MSNWSFINNVDSNLPYIEDNIQQNGYYNNNMMHNQYIDERSFSDDSMRLVKKKEMNSNNGEIEHFRSTGGHGRSGGMAGRSINRGSMQNRPMNRGGYNRHHGGHRKHWNSNNWIVPTAIGYGGGWASGYYSDGQNYIDDGYYYDDYPEQPIVQNIYLENDDKLPEESSIKIESLSEEKDRKKNKKLKKLKKIIKEENSEDNKELSKKTLWSIIVFLIVILVIMGFKILIDHKYIRF